MCDGRGERKDREGEGGRGIAKEVNLYRRVMERRTGQQIMFFQIDRILLYVPDLFTFSSMLISIAKDMNMICYLFYPT